MQLTAKKAVMQSILNIGKLKRKKNIYYYNNYKLAKCAPCTIILFYNLTHEIHNFNDTLI